jgi:hypothetical protein
MLSDMSDQVTLRPVAEDDLPVMEKLTWDPATAGEFALFRLPGTAAGQARPRVQGVQPAHPG